MSQILNDDASSKDEGSTIHMVLELHQKRYLIQSEFIPSGYAGNKPPEEIATNHLKKLLIVDESISVAEFENKNPGYKINLVFYGERPCYPNPELPLNGKSILVTY